MSNRIAKCAAWISTIALLLLAVGCTSGKSVSEPTLAFRTAAEEALTGEIAWEGHVEAGGVDKTASMPRIRSGYAGYLTTDSSTSTISGHSGAHHAAGMHTPGRW